MIIPPPDSIPPNSENDRNDFFIRTFDIWQLPSEEIQKGILRSDQLYDSRAVEIQRQAGVQVTPELARDIYKDRIQITRLQSGMRSVAQFRFDTPVDNLQALDLDMPISNVDLSFQTRYANFTASYSLLGAEYNHIGGNVIYPLSKDSKKAMTRNTIHYDGEDIEDSLNILLRYRITQDSTSDIQIAHSKGKAFSTITSRRPNDDDTFSVAQSIYRSGELVQELPTYIVPISINGFEAQSLLKDYLEADDGVGAIWFAYMSDESWKIGY